MVSIIVRTNPVLDIRQIQLFHHVYTLKFDKLTIWVPILVAVGPFLVPISSETGFLFTGP